MSTNDIERIVIRHVSGSKANQIEQIPFVGLTEITIGRDPSSNIAFDSPRDDIASRRHAVIRVVRGDQISFRLADLASSNGTFLNGERITEEKELLPEDTIGLGKNGLKFIFDVQPRPANLVSRTRVIDINDPATTRVIKTAEIAASTAAQDVVTKGNISVEPAAQRFEPPPKPGIGKETVIRMLGEERRATSRVWISALVGVAAFAALGGGAFYWKHKHDLEEMKNQKMILASKVDQSKADVEQRAEDEERKREEERGLTPQDIVKKFGNTTAKVDRTWRLYDQQTGKPVFHQTFKVTLGRGKNQQSFTYPAYVQLPGNLGIVRWLTLGDDNRTNIEIGGKASGTGFVVSEQGFMLTNKHVAAPWNLAFGQEDPANAYGHGWLYQYKGGPGARDPKLRTPTLIDLNDDDYYVLQRPAASSSRATSLFWPDNSIFPTRARGSPIRFSGETTCSKFASRTAA
jgi:serine protease Do